MANDIYEGFQLEAYKKFLEERVIILNENIGSSIIEKVVLPIWRINQQDDADQDSKSFNRNDFPIRIFISSSGGFVSQSLSAISAIITSKTPVYTYCLDRAESAAFMIFIVGHKRFIQPYSRLMYHSIAAGYEDNIQGLRDKLDEMENLRIIYQDIVKKYTKITQKQLDAWEKMHKDKTFYSAEAIGKLKLADLLW